MKPFVTIEQVDAIFKQLIKEMPDDFIVPIHKELLVSMSHQHFLKTFALLENKFQEEDAYIELAERYCAEAVEFFVAMVKEDTINNCVIKFFTQAKCIDLEIDRFYS